MTIKRFKFKGSEYAVVSATCSKGPTSSPSAEYKLLCHREGTNEYDLMEIINAYEIHPEPVVCQPLWMEPVEAMVNRVLDRISRPNLKGLDQVLFPLLEYIEEAIEYKIASQEVGSDGQKVSVSDKNKEEVKSKLWSILRHFQGEQ